MIPLPLLLFQKPISIRATLSIVIVSMGLLSIGLSFMAGSIYRDLTFDNQREALATLVDLKADDALNKLRTISGTLSVQLAAETRFKQAFDAGDPVAIQTQINEQFFQYYVTAQVIDLSKLYVFDVDFKNLTESTEGGSKIPTDSTICPNLLKKAKQRKGAQRVALVSELCVFQGKPYFSVISAIGGLKPKGYIQVVSNPIQSLQHIETELGIPINIRLNDGSSTYQSKNWPDENTAEQVLLAKDLLHTEQSEIALSIEVASPVEELMNKLAKTRVMIVIIAMFVTLLSVWLVIKLLKSTTINPLRSLTRQLRRVRKDKSHLGEMVSVKGNIEVRQLAEDFNEMTG
ncbi:MAG: HAMP domain-containing protein, partial [Gammaproteobacteria bacterium]|nr:HAMP domain-containing protein [Gammaproteobacteria bacterium]